MDEYQYLVTIKVDSDIPGKRNQHDMHLRNLIVGALEAETLDVIYDSGTRDVAYSAVIDEVKVERWTLT